MPHVPMEDLGSTWSLAIEWRCYLVRPLIVVHVVSTVSSTDQYRQNSLRWRSVGRFTFV